MLQLKESTGKLKVERFGMKPLPAEMIVDGSIMDGLGVVTAIKELATEQKLKNKNVALSISGTSVIVKKITLPPMPEEELDKQIKFEAEQYIPFDITTSTWISISSRRKNSPPPRRVRWKSCWSLPRRTS